MNCSTVRSLLAFAQKFLLAILLGVLLVFPSKGYGGRSTELGNAPEKATPVFAPPALPEHNLSEAGRMERSLTETNRTLPPRLKGDPTKSFPKERPTYKEKPPHEKGHTLAKFSYVLGGVSLFLFLASMVLTTLAFINIYAMTILAAFAVGAMIGAIPLGLAALVLGIIAMVKIKDSGESFYQALGGILLSIPAFFVALYMALFQIAYLI